jgi:hypothetical protein
VDLLFPWFWLDSVRCARRYCEAKDDMPLIPELWTGLGTSMRRAETKMDRLVRILNCLRPFQRDGRSLSDFARNLDGGEECSESTRRN